MDRNSYMLKGRLAKRGYDWWWHNFVAKNKKTGELRPFFIEYYIINPSLGSGDIIPGQLKAIKDMGLRPSYAMVKAGAWGKKAVQVNNLYAVDKFSCAPEGLDVKIGKNICTETLLKGEVELSKKDAKDHPEFMSDAGHLKWNLKAEKILPFNVGYGASRLFRLLGAFRMYWHAQGMYTRYKGSIWLNGEEYTVTPDTSFGYQDKNWGCDYTNPWIWLSCNNFVSVKTGKQMKNTSLDVGGGRPVVFGVPLMKKILVAFYYDGKFHEYNFSKFWRSGSQAFNCTVDDKKVTWDIEAYNAHTKVEISFSCPRNTMILVSYENPDGEKNHNALYNGGYAAGTLKFYRKEKGAWVLADELKGELGGCEFGEY